MKYAGRALSLVLSALQSSDAVTLLSAGAPQVSMSKAWHRGNISLWTSRAGQPEFEMSYEGTGCESWCFMEGGSTDDVPCDIPPCAKCESCGSKGAEFEVGSIVVGGFKRTDPQKYAFTAPFKEVPIVVVLPTTRGGHPAAIRIANVTKESFTAVIVEPPGEDGPHVSMTVAFMAAMPGVHTLPDGRVVQAKRVSTKKQVMGWRCKATTVPVQDWESVTFEQAFISKPALVATVQTMRNELGKVPKKVSTPWLTVAVKDLMFTNFKVALDKAETGIVGNVTEPEDIGIIAMAAGAGSFSTDTAGLISYTALVSTPVVRGWSNGKGQTVELGSTLGSSKPLVVGGQCSRRGGDGGWLRLRRVTPTSVKVTVDEDRHCDKERSHTFEQACIIAWSGPFVL